ncbi:uncharacterized protein METZ01_LOCUS133483 [marine metagenome]|uniref:Uncharacterized protein n=1 Tax=marine metagenome TaxID=408172 RepID=A0A381YUH2_9ZZZZ
MADEFNFDDYDDNMDFGFNTVDEAEVTEYESEIKSRVADAGGVASGELESKIDKLIAIREGDETQLDVLKKEHKNDLLKVEKMIMPLLYNLMKNPEDVYIKWPNRKEIIQKQINKIVAVTRKSLPI